MTDQYRATPKQWDNQKAWAVDDDDSSCILELRARIETLDARYETQRQVTLAWGKDVYNHGRWIDAHLKRIKALEAGQKAKPSTAQSGAAPAPADSLVERVCVEAGIHNPADARAAIREVAAALIDWYDSDEVVRTAYEAGQWLKREADA
jgi:hypothetical protein